ncbi:MAG: Glu-tRNA(Gln) amidotransferase subunit GatE [Candidatus Brocadiia bacterium]
MTYYVKRRSLPDNLDYEAIGLMSGVEIHQQLFTTKKMFCRCLSRHYSEEFNTSVLRHMRPTLSEMGEYDGTALMEFKKKKEIVYLVNQDSTCTYELDDTPPFLVNEDALDIAIELALMLNCSVVDELHITRKQYLDGSIPTGFQRTAIVGIEGSIPVNGKRIGIIQLGFEEDSCREVTDIGHTITYRPDRLGMPLIEAVTYPDMRHPVEVAQVVEAIGRLLRTSGKVRRGIGSVRQDVNVSVRGGTRIEIKGVPRIPYIPMLVHIEAGRQVQLLQLRDELHKRGLNRPDAVVSTDADVTEFFTGTEHPILGKALKNGLSISACTVRGVAGLTEWPTQPDRVFADEIKGRLRVVACLDEKPHMYSSIDFASSGIPQQKVDDMHRLLGATENDSVFLVWGTKRDAKLGCSEILLRWREATMGVPSETRQHMADGHTDYERTLPGPERMYPDTDHPPRQLAAKRIADIKAKMQAPPWVREEGLRGLSIPEDCVYHLAISPNFGLFNRVVNELHVPAVFAARILDREMRALARSGVRVKSVSAEILFEFFKMFIEGHIVREALAKAITAAAANPALSAAQVVDLAELKPVGEKEALGVLEGVNKKAASLSFERDEQRSRFVMGTAMHSLRGKFPGDNLYRLYSSR